MTTPAPGTPKTPTKSALKIFSGNTIILNADKHAIIAPPASEFIITRITPRVLSRVTHTVIPVIAAAAININAVSKYSIRYIYAARLLGTSANNIEISRKSARRALTLTVSFVARKS